MHLLPPTHPPPPTHHPPLPTPCVGVHERTDDQAVIFGPDDTPWEGGTFKLLLEFSEDYPNKPPSVRFLTRMWVKWSEAVPCRAVLVRCGAVWRGLACRYVSVLSRNHGVSCREAFPPSRQWEGKCRPYIWYSYRRHSLHHLTTHAYVARKIVAGMHGKIPMWWQLLLVCLAPRLTRGWAVLPQTRFTGWPERGAAFFLPQPPHKVECSRPWEGWDLGR